MPLFNGKELSSQSLKNLEIILSLVKRPPADWPESLFAGGDTSHLVTFVNPFAVYYANKSSSYVDNLRLFDLVLPDGILLASIASLIHGTTIPRISFDGNSLAPEIFSIASKLNLSVFLVGGQPGVPEEAAKHFEKDLGVPIVGYRHGFFQDMKELENFCRVVTEKMPRIVICGMGVGLQEKFLLCLQKYGWRGAGFTCGGYLEQAAHAGSVEYYPSWVSSFNLRAFYRVYKEPKKLGWRYTHDYWPFYVAAVLLLIGNRRLSTRKTF